MHGDAVPVTKIGKAGPKSMDVYSTSGLLGAGTAMALTSYMLGIFTNSEVRENGNTASTRLFWQGCHLEDHIIYSKAVGTTRPPT